MKISIDLNIDKAKVGLSLAYPNKDVKHMTDNEIIELFVKVNKKYGVIEEK